MQDGKKHRVYFALWPDPSTVEKIRARQDRLGTSLSGRAVVPENLHLTLVFLGEVDGGQLERLRSIAAGITGEPVDLCLDRQGIWTRSQAAWLAPGTTPQALIQLVQSLRRQLQSAGFAVEQTTFRPHITLFRKARGGIPTTAVPPFCWHAAEFVLVESDLQPEGARYHVLDRFPLHGAAGPL